MNYAGDGRTLGRVDGKPDAHFVRSYDDAMFRRIVLSVYTADCFTIVWRPTEDRVGVAQTISPGIRMPPELLSVVGCGVRPGVRDGADLQAELRFSNVFDGTEGCPRLFHGQTAVTDALGGGWSRDYRGLDALHEADTTRVMLNQYRTDTCFNLGAPAQWEGNDPPPIAACTARAGVAR